MKLKLIEQMRLVAGQCSDMWAQEKFTELIDYLERSGALVPVADGETCDLDEVPPETWTVIYKNNLYYREEGGYSWAAFTDSVKPPFLQSFSVVQPVRLVPIAEAQIDGN